MYKKIGKRAFDFVFALLGVICFSPVIILACIISSFIHGGSGIFTQDRIGLGGKVFKIFKIKTMFDGSRSTVTVKGQSNISALGTFLRRYKLDEVPQLINVLIGDMSFVGPRPDIPKMYENLDIKTDLIFKIKPGITGPAQLAFKNEEELLSLVQDPEKYAEDVLWPKKLKMNRSYATEYSFLKDISVLIGTFK